MRRLVDVGWDPGDAADCIALMADDAHARSTGGAGTRWRRAALRIGIPQWRARRLATLLLGDGPVPGVIALAAVHGPEIIHDPAIQAALESTTRRWSAGPVAWLAPWDPDVAAQVGA